jgi:hypothetical protein
MHGFCVWFDVTFDPHHTYKTKTTMAAAEEEAGDNGKRPSGQVVVLSTAPGEKPTHWKQTFILLPADRGFPVNPDTSTSPPLALALLKTAMLAGGLTLELVCVYRLQRSREAWR